MKLDLLKLAKQIENDSYRDVKCSFGDVRVYHVPTPVTWTYMPDRREPIKPTIRMKTATGFQNRVIKETDKEWEEWQKDVQDYENEVYEIRLAASYTLALRDIEYPDLSKSPPLAAKLNNIEYPESELMRKKMWLDYTVLARTSDIELIQAAIRNLSANLSEDNIDGIKKNSESDIRIGQLDNEGIVTEAES